MGCDYCEPDDCSCYPICDRYNKAEQKQVELKEHSNYPNCLDCQFYKYEFEEQKWDGCSRHPDFKCSEVTHCEHYQDAV